MTEKKTLPLKHGKTHLAYITDEEEKILRDLFHNNEGDPEVKYFNGVPMLDWQQQQEQAAAQKLYNKQKAAGWKTVRDPNDQGGSIWAPPANQESGFYVETPKKTTTKKAAATPKKAVVKNSAVPTVEDYHRTVQKGSE